MSLQGPLIDTYGRVVRDLRISVTDRCNLRCVYCMPAEGMKWLPKEGLLTYEEIARFTRICIALGVTGVRLTGGEPTVRADLPVLVRMLRALRPDLDLSITTNGLKLAAMAQPLAQAGLRRVNVSLDTLRRERFQEICRRDRLHEVLAGLGAAEAAGLHPIKINTVAMRGFNADEVVDLVAWGRERGYQVRFIEFMPLDAQHEWSRDRLVPAQEIVERVHAAFPVKRVAPRAVNGSAPGAGGWRPTAEGQAQDILVIAPEVSEPASVYRFTDGKGSFGVIASVTRPFCGHCDRIRLTADGQIRTCLFSLTEYDFREAMRGGASDEEIAELLRAAVWRKEPGHKINAADFVQPERGMSAIGG
jgi:cyclic pyranopterin phosphate synthase